MVFAGSHEEARAWGWHTYSDYVDLRDQNSVFSGLAAYKMAAAAISASEQRGERTSEQADVIWGEIVSGNYFDLLGVRPALGRTFSPDEDRTPNAHPVVVLNYGFWQRRFRSDPELLGRAIYLNGRPFTPISTGRNPLTFRDENTPVLLGNSENLPLKR